MNTFQLVEITTQDQLMHQGVFFAPAKPGKRALLWVHGLTSNFYSNVSLLNTFVEFCAKEKYGFAAFNNRGHDMITGLRKLDETQEKGYTHVTLGAGYEVFRESFYDIEAGVAFLNQQGFSEVIVVGHSTGALKVNYYAAFSKNDQEIGYVLAGPAADRLMPGLDPKLQETNILYMEKLIEKGKGDTLVSGLSFFPLTPRRYLSLFKTHSLEDQFDYGDETPKLTHFRKIKKPLLVVFGEKDEYLDRPVQDVFSVLKKASVSSHYTNVTIPQAGHSFTGFEKEFVRAIIEWSKKT